MKFSSGPQCYNTRTLFEFALPNVLNVSRIYLMYTNKSKLMKTANLPNETLNNHCHNDRFFSAKDMIESEIHK